LVRAVVKGLNPNVHASSCCMFVAGYFHFFGPAEDKEVYTMQ